jgi:uncharacterized damage-inducible protein DinB
MRKVQQVTALSGYEPEIGRWLWAMEEVRGTTLKLVEDLDQVTLDWEGPDGRENAIGSLLYHIALVEMSWLFLDILEQEFPSPVKSDFPLDMGSVEGGLTRAPNIALAEHLGRLERSRAIFLDSFRRMTLDDWRRFRSPEGVDYQMTPEWAVFHLVEHEAGHAFQISALKARARRFFRNGSMAPQG